MLYKETVNIFNRLFPSDSNDELSFFPNGKNSIRVRNRGEEDFIFTFYSPNKWKFETIDSFIDSKKED